MKKNNTPAIRDETCAKHVIAAIVCRSNAIENARVTRSEGGGGVVFYSFNLISSAASAALCCVQFVPTFRETGYGWLVCRYRGVGEKGALCLRLETAVAVSMWKI